MKKFTLSLAVMATMFAASAATYEVNFTNTNQATTPDSVVVEIVNKETKTVKAGEILSLVLTTDAADAEVAESGLSVYPNPVTDVATVEYYNTAAGEVSVMVTNTNGATVATLAQDLPAGKLSFSLSGLAAGSYVVTACSAGTECESTLVVSENANSASPSLSYVSADENEQLQAVSTLKKASLVPMVTMNYVDGDVVNFTAYMGQGMLVKNNIVISANTTVSFPFVGYTSFSAPDSVKFDSVITVTGVNFGADKGALTVTVNGKEQTISTLTDTEITFAVAKKTFSGNIAITKDGYTVEGDEVTYHNTYTVGSKIFDEDIAYFTIDPLNGNYIYRAKISNTYSYLAVMDKDGTVIDTIHTYTDDGYFITGLEWSNQNDTLYMICGYGRLLYLLPGTYEQGVIIDQDINANIVSSPHYRALTKDNEGYLYITNDNKQLIKLSPSNPTYSEVITLSSTNNTNTPVVYHNGVFYYSTDSGNSLRKINADGTGDTELVSVANGITSLEYIEGIGLMYGVAQYGLHIYNTANNSHTELFSNTKNDLGIEYLNTITQNSDKDLIVAGDGNPGVKGVVNVIVE